MPTKEEWYRTYMEWIEKCELSDRLTEWEENFIKSIKKFLTERGFLSPKQAEILERIYADKTD